jgi:hypothetical protein
VGSAHTPPTSGAPLSISHQIWCGDQIWCGSGRAFYVRVTGCVWRALGRVRGNARKGLAATRATPWRRCMVTAHGKDVAGSRRGGGRTTAVQARREARAARSGSDPVQVRAPSIPGPCVSVALAFRTRDAARRHEASRRRAARAGVKLGLVKDKAFRPGQGSTCAREGGGLSVPGLQRRADSCEVGCRHRRDGSRGYCGVGAAPARKRDRWS